MYRYNPYKTIEEEVFSSRDELLMPFPQVANKTQWMTSFMVDASENGIHEANVHKANQVLIDGVENYLDYKLKCANAGVHLSPGDLHEVWGEFWSYHRDEEIDNEVNEILYANA